VTKPALFIDRDGVLVRNRDDYVKTLDEMEVLPGAIEALAALSKHGHRVFVITNQSAIGRGRTTRAEVDRMHEQLSSEVRRLGGRIDAFLVCPHTPEDGCDCRKPAPGLLYQARDGYGVDLKSAVVIGDAPSDLGAARAAGCASILVLTGITPATSSDSADHVVATISEAARLITG
jgi:D-glycero-D-manno-heptose 1,7-bisphosphate phosphatase